MRQARRSFPSWTAVFPAVGSAVGAAGAPLARSDVTGARVTDTVKDADDGALPSLTIAVNRLQRTLGGS